MKLTSTRAASAAHLKVLVHGPPGAGKTRLCATTPDPKRTLIISAEGGLLSLREYDIPVVDVAEGIDLGDPKSGAAVLRNLREVYAALRGSEAATYDWVCLDSVSEIAEVVLAHGKASEKDARAAYGDMADVVFALLRGFRNLPMNVYMSSRQRREEIDGVGTLFVPALPGRQVSQGIGFLFDEVFALRTRPGRDGEPAIVRALQTTSDGLYEAKDRSGALAHYESPSLTKLAAKIAAVTQPVTQPATQPTSAASAAPTVTEEK